MVARWWESAHRPIPGGAGSSKSGWRRRQCLILILSVRLTPVGAENLKQAARNLLLAVTEADGECDEASCRTSIVAGSRVGAEHAASAGCMASPAHHICRALWSGRVYGLGWPADRTLRRKDIGEGGDCRQPRGRRRHHGHAGGRDVGGRSRYLS